VDRRSSAQAASFDWRRSVNSAASLAATTDGRWALVSTSITAIVAGTMAWLAVNAMPPLTAKTQAGGESFMPYRVFAELTRAGRDYSSALFGSAPVRTKPVAAPPPVQADDSDDDNPSPGIETRTLNVERGDTVQGILQDAGVPSDEAAAVVVALTKVYDTRTMRAGQTLQATFEAAPTPKQPAAAPPVVVINGLDSGADEDSGDTGSVTQVQPTPAGRLLSISFSPSVEHNITISRTTDGGFSAEDVVKPLVAHLHRAGATVDSSLYLAATQAGIPTDIVVSMIKMFSYKIDFQRELHPGDSFEVYYSYYYTPDGVPAKSGDIDYARMTIAGKEIALYRYQPTEDDEPDYYDASGASVKGTLMKTPVDGARITSGFGMRFHPILGYTRMHKGIDFGVPIGTPVMAAGTGTIKTMGVENGYGNFVLIQHAEGISTAYGHLSRFAAGLHAGSHVAQGQVFAYSGMSGMATGPHLHYEIRINNIQVNPLLVKFATGRKLDGSELRDFLTARLHLDEVLASTPLETKVADGNNDLRQAKAQ
jgi:murein DD-endopeptidase MepM/ murein hydrolase activator NlpD